MATLEERLAALETLVTAGDVVSTASRLSALDARTAANEKASDRATAALEKAQMLANDVLTNRFDAANEVRGAMTDAARQFVTRGEFQWAMGTVLLMLVGMLINLLLRR